nr:hypothetical protein PanWU01x14_004960 [Ipomoea batatas]
MPVFCLMKCFTGCYEITTSVSLPDNRVKDLEEYPAVSNPAVWSGHPQMLTSSVMDSYKKELLQFDTSSSTNFSISFLKKFNLSFKSFETHDFSLNFLTTSHDNSGSKTPETTLETPYSTTNTKLSPTKNLTITAPNPHSLFSLSTSFKKPALALEFEGGDTGADEFLLDLGVEKLEGSNKTGLRGFPRAFAVENLPREFLWMVLGIRSRVALMLAMQISHLQLASFRHPGK